jgi:flagellar assembly factor FliW
MDLCWVLGRDYEPFTWMSSLDETGLDLIVVAPGALFSDHVIEIPETETAMLELSGAGEVAVLVPAVAKPPRGST